MSLEDLKEGGEGRPLDQIFMKSTEGPNEVERNGKMYLTSLVSARLTASSISVEMH